jgi:hypothetical protein
MVTGTFILRWYAAAVLMGLLTALSCVMLVVAGRLGARAT